MQKGLALPFIILIVLVLLVFGAMVVERIVFNDRHINPPKMSKLESGKECLPNPNPVFQGKFIDISKVVYIRPLGNTQADSINSSYIVVKTGEEVPIYNPTDATLEEIIKKDGKYGLLFRVSCEITFYFENLDRLSDGIQSGSLIKQGEVLGFVKGDSQGRSFKFMLSNSLKPIAHLNAKRWEKDIYAQCPYEYFSANENNLRQTYFGYTLVHNENVIQKDWSKEQGISQIPCGELSHDIKGIVSGGWFKGESTDIKGEFLSVNKYLSTVQVSLRKDGELMDVLTDYSPDTLVTDVKVGNAACYSDVNQNKWAFVKLISERELALVRGVGSCPASFPESAETWER